MNIEENEKESVASLITDEMLREIEESAVQRFINGEITDVMRDIVLADPRKFIMTVYECEGDFNKAFRRLFASKANNEEIIDHFQKVYKNKEDIKNNIIDNLKANNIELNVDEIKAKTETFYQEGKISESLRDYILTKAENMAILTQTCDYDLLTTLQGLEKIGSLYKEHVTKTNDGTHLSQRERIKFVLENAPILNGDK